MFFVVIPIKLCTVGFHTLYNPSQPRGSFFMAQVSSSFHFAPIDTSMSSYIFLGTMQDDAKTTAPPMPRPWRLDENDITKLGEFMHISGRKKRPKSEKLQKSTWRVKVTKPNYLNALRK